MRKLMIVLFSAALLLAPFADTSDARGGRRSRGGGISGASAGRSSKGSAKEKQRRQLLVRSEERDSLIDGKLRRRSR